MDVGDPNVDLEGQGHRSRSPGQKNYFGSHPATLQAIFEVKSHMGQGQRSHGSRSKVFLKDQGQRSPGQKCDIRSHLTVLQITFKVMGQRQRSCGSRSKVKLVKPRLKVMILAGGLTPTSSCIFESTCAMHGGLLCVAFCLSLDQNY